MNLIDKVLEFVSPQMAVERAASRKKLDLIRGYEAGSYGKRQNKIDRRVNAPSNETLNLEKIRGFSRNLQRNNGDVHKALEVLVNNIIGDGIRPAIYYPGKDTTAKRTKYLWKQWAHTTECDFDGINDFYGLEELICLSAHRDGEVLVIKKRSKNWLLPIKLQVLEADFLDHGKSGPAENNSGEIIQGVEFNMEGQRVAYWLFEKHPYETTIFATSESKRIPASEVMHIFRMERAGQVRGVPTGVQAFIKIQDLEEYQDAELIRKKISACHTVFVKTNAEPGALGLMQREATRMEPGTIQFMQPGDEIQLATPPSSEGHNEYVKGRKQNIAAAYGITYESLTNDLSNVNFSSGRMGWLEANRNFKKWQNRVIIPRFCSVSFDWFQEAALMAGFVKNKATATWTPPRREMIDPVKETEAMGNLLRLGLNSWQEAVRELGWDWEELRQELLEDKTTWESAKGVMEAMPYFEEKKASQLDSDRKNAKEV